MPLVARLADVRLQLDHPPGVVLGVLRLPILDPLLQEVETAFDSAEGEATFDQALVAEIERLVQLLSERMLGMAIEAVGRRARLVELIRRSHAGELPPIAFDDGDAFGAELRAMLGTDRSLRLALGCLHPLVIRATAVAPPPRWTTEARRVLATPTDVDLTGAIRRTLASLLRSDIVSRPDILAGGLRLANQRLARGVLWFASVALDAPAELIGSVGVRMGTSGRNDAVVRDTAVANTCAALLGASNDPGAAAALATMRVRVTNRNVLKQVDRALEVVAERAGIQVATLIELSLPTFDLGSDGRIELPIDGTTAVIAVTGDATVRQVWRETDGTELDRAGLDTRAFRSPWPEGCVVFELDRAAILEHKATVLDRAGAVPRCERRIVVADLRAEWADSLADAGFDRDRPAAWLLEGLLFYLPADQVVRLLDAITALASSGSQLGFDIVNAAILSSPYTKPWVDMQAAAGAPWLGTMEDPVGFLAERGWAARLSQAGQPDANHGRWTLPVVPTTLPDFPHSWFVTATREG